MTNSNTNAVADETVKAEAHENVPNITEVLVQAYDHSSYGVGVRQFTDILNPERISPKCCVLGVDTDRRKVITR